MTEPGELCNFRQGTVPVATPFGGVFIPRYSAGTYLAGGPEVLRVGDVGDRRAALPAL